MGHTAGDEFGYMLLTFIDGEDEGRALPRLSGDDQFRIGLEAGEELRRMHAYAAPPDISPWRERKPAKHEGYLRAHLDGDIRIKGDDKFIAFIEKNLALIQNRPNRFQHDDFDARNLIVRNGRFAGVIDFNRCDWGDPYHEFLRVGQFSAEVSVPFSIGQIRGYFEERDPDELFWNLYSLYIAMALISGVIWTKHVCPQEMPDMMKKFMRVLDDHDGFDRVRPKWYKS